MKEILKYIAEGITIDGNPIDGYQVFTIPTQWFGIDSLEQLTPETFEEVIVRQKEFMDFENKIFRVAEIVRRHEEVRKVISFVDACRKARPKRVWVRLTLQRELGYDSIKLLERIGYNIKPEIDRFGINYIINYQFLIKN